MRALKTPFQVIHSLKGLKKKKSSGLGHPESACLCYKPGYKPPPAKCKYSRAKGRWICRKKRRRS